MFYKMFQQSMDPQHAQKNIGEIMERANQEYTRWRKEMEMMREKAKWYVRYHPTRSMMYSAGAGIFLGITLGCLLRRRKRQ